MGLLMRPVETEVSTKLEPAVITRSLFQSLLEPVVTTRYTLPIPSDDCAVSSIGVHRVFIKPRSRMERRSPTALELPWASEGAASFVSEGNPVTPPVRPSSCPVRPLRTPSSSDSNNYSRRVSFAFRQESDEESWASEGQVGPNRRRSLLFLVLVLIPLGIALRYGTSSLDVLLGDSPFDRLRHALLQLVRAFGGFLVGFAVIKFLLGGLRGGKKLIFCLRRSWTRSCANFCCFAGVRKYFRHEIRHQRQRVYLRGRWRYKPAVRGSVMGWSDSESESDSDRSSVISIGNSAQSNSAQSTPSAALFP